MKEQKKEKTRKKISKETKDTIIKIGDSIAALIGVALIYNLAVRVTKNEDRIAELTKAVEIHNGNFDIAEEAFKRLGIDVYALGKEIDEASSK